MDVVTKKPYLLHHFLISPLAKFAPNTMSSVIKNHFTIYHSTLNPGMPLRRYSNKKPPQNSTRKKTSVGDVIGGYDSKNFMANMSYCRFENTLRDLRDCYSNMDSDDLSQSEFYARKQMIELCWDITKNIVT